MLIDTHGLDYGNSSDDQAGGMNNEIKLLKNKANKILGEINKLVMILIKN